MEHVADKPRGILRSVKDFFILERFCILELGFKRAICEMLSLQSHQMLAL